MGVVGGKNIAWREKRRCFVGVEGLARRWGVADRSVGGGGSAISAGIGVEGRC